MRGKDRTLRKSERDAQMGRMIQPLLWRVIRERELGLSLLSMYVREILYMCSGHIYIVECENLLGKVN